MRWGHLIGRGMLQPIVHPAIPGAKTAFAPGFPLKFSGADVGYHAAAAMPAENNDEVYRGLLGLSRLELDGLKQAGVI